MSDTQAVPSPVPANARVTSGTSGEVKLDDAMRHEYEMLYASAVLNPKWLGQLDNAVLRIAMNVALYQKVAAKVGGLPWYFIAAVHLRERNLSLKHHLHNGDPLHSRTVHHPAGRPTSSTPPFLWEVSAEDALRYQRLDRWTDWSLAGLLYQLEAYNGFGYRRKGMATPYLWSATSHYAAGKYVEVKDPETGKYRSEYRPGLVDQQLGVAALVKHLVERKIVEPAHAPK
jgi:lysozyme family protein